MNGSVPVEIEIKLRIPDAARGRELLESNGFRVTAARVFEANALYDTESGDLRSSGRLLRLRQAGEQAILTFKGPASKGRHKAREEREVLVSDGEVLASILSGLGYRSTFRYEKYRTEYARPSEAGHALLDETPIGCFLELEGPPEWIDEAAQRLGFTDANYLTSSYGSLYLEYCERTRTPRGNMVFATA